MKRLKKSDIIKLSQVDHVISENTILADIDHPFLVSDGKSSLARRFITKAEMTEQVPQHGAKAHKSLTLTMSNALIGRSARFHSGLPLPVFPDAVHPRWRAVHLLAH